MNKRNSQKKQLVNKFSSRSLETQLEAVDQGSGVSFCRTLLIVDMDRKKKQRKMTQSLPSYENQSELSNTSQSHPPPVVQSEPSNSNQSQPFPVIQYEPSKTIQFQPFPSIQSAPSNASQSQPFLVIHSIQANSNHPRETIPNYPL